MQEPFRNKKSRSYRLRPASGRDRLDSRVRRLCSRLGILAVVVAAAIVIRSLYNIQILHGAEYRQYAAQQQLLDTTIKATRGEIYDASGITLASTSVVWTIWADPSYSSILYTSKTNDDDTVTKTLDPAMCAEVSRELTLRLLSGDGESLDSVDTSSAEYQQQYQTVYDALSRLDSAYVTLATKVNNAVKLSIEKYVTSFNKTHKKATDTSRKGRISVSSEKSFQRNYPYGAFAAAVLGFTDADGVGTYGLEKSYQGEVVFSPGYSVGYLAQEPYLDNTKTVKEIVMEGVQPIVDALNEYEEINQKFGLPEYYEDQDKMDLLFARQGELQDIIDATDAWNLDSKLERAMDALRCPPEDQLVENLSGGERRRVALCRLLLQKPDILLLDEPTNHLDAESIDWLEQHLQQYEGTVIAVTHDRYFLDHVAGWILELDRGEGIPWKGNYSSWLEQKTKRMEMEEKTASKRRKTLERELDWVRMAPKARQAKGKARLNSYDKLLNEDVKEKEEKLEIFIPNGPRLGNKVIEAKHVAKAYGDKLLFDDLNFMLPPNGIVGIIGPNGAGKTTLFRLIMGLDAVDKGEFEVGETVKVAYVDQQHKDIDPNKTVYQVISGGTELIRMGGRDINARAYLSRFNFSGADQEKLCGMLSGGERNRLHLAIALKEEGNVLLLDEPTNDIDVNTLRALEEGLEDFAGCAVVISHDRWFLDRICTHILAFEGDSKVFYFEGSYSEYEENKKKRLGDVEPHRVRYRKLME